MKTIVMSQNTAQRIRLHICIHVHSDDVLDICSFSFNDLIETSVGWFIIIGRTHITSRFSVIKYENNCFMELINRISSSVT